jgi:putative redox protein
MVNARVKYQDGLQFIGEAASGHAIVMDGPPEVGGGNTGMRPMELLLVGLGGCTGMDVVSILKKKKQPLTGLEINIRGEKAEEHPQRYTGIEIEFIVKGRGLEDSAVKRAIDLSMEKYCSVKATVECSAKVSTSYKIEEA